MAYVTVPILCKVVVCVLRWNTTGTSSRYVKRIPCQKIYQKTAFHNLAVGMPILNTASNFNIIEETHT